MNYCQGKKITDRFHKYDVKKTKPVKEYIVGDSISISLRMQAEGTYSVRRENGSPWGAVTEREREGAPRSVAGGVRILWQRLATLGRSFCEMASTCAIFCRYVILQTKC